MNTIKMKIRFTSILAIVLFFAAQAVSFSQNLDEIQKKIKESGMTESDVKAKADAAGFTLEDYNKLQTESVKKETANNAAVTQEKVIVTPPNPQKTTSFASPEFQGREGAEGLQAFGYNIFNYAATTFEPSLNVPVPTNYVVGPGDELIITLWGETQLVHNLTVSKNGDIYIPNVGLVSVNGLTLNELKSKVYSSLSKVYASLKSSDVETKTKFDISTGKLRSVKVYVLGEVNTPGGYTLPALSTSFTVLYYCGGPTINGSLRNIQVMRAGKTIAKIDLYEYLLTGNISKDIRLEDEDIIFVPPVGKRVAVNGAAFRPAVYELKDKENLADLMNFAKGVRANAFIDRVHIERIIPFSQRKEFENNILSIDLKFNSVNELSKSNYSLEDQDVVSIQAINTLPENRVSITGFVKKPGVYEIPSGGIKIKDLILKADSLQKEAFLDKGILIRTLPSEKKEIFNFNVSRAMKGDPENNLPLKNRDEIRIFNQKTFFPERSVEITGAVKNPGLFTRFEKMSLVKLISLAGGLTDRATTKNIEITRTDSTDMNVFSKKFIVNLPNEYWKDDSHIDFILEDHDRVFIKTDPLINFSQNVSINGEVLYPGAYTILYEGEKLSDFIKRTGGFKSTAYTGGMYIERDRKLIERSILHIPDTLLFRNRTVSLFNPGLITDLSHRIPIDWDKVVKDSASIFNVRLEPGDIVVVPRDPQTVTVVGDVGIPSSVPHKKGASRDYYIKQAGGYKETSAKGDEIVIQPNGKKWEPSGFFLIPDNPIESGSTIIVPTRIEYNKSSDWVFIRDIVTVLSSAAVVILTVWNLTK